MFGYGDYGQLGQPTDQSSSSTSNSIFSSFFSGGSSKIQLIKTPSKIKVPSATNFTQIACGNRHSAAINDEGHLYTWGWNGSFLTSNALGHGKRNRNNDNNWIPKRIESLMDHKIIQVSCGDKHTLCLTSDGEIYAFGYGEHGRLGTGHTSSYSLPVKLSYFNDIQMSFICAAKEFSFAISADSDVEFDAVDNDYSVPYGWGRNDRNQMGIGGGLAMDMYSCDPTPQPINLKNIIDLGLSDGDVIAVDVDGGVYQWGDRLYLSPQNINHERAIDEQIALNVGDEGGEKERIVKVDITSSMMCYVTNYGNVYTCSKTFGMKSDICSLGQGSVEPYKIVKKVESLDEEFVCDVVCADGRCLAVTM